MALLLVAGCLPVSPPPGTSQTGPTVTFVVTNNSGSPVVVGFEFEAAGTSGAGEADVVCGGSVIQFGEMVGTYSVSVAGDEVASGEVSRAARPGSYLVFRLIVAEDGSATALGPDVTARVPLAEAGRPCG